MSDVYYLWRYSFAERRWTNIRLFRWIIFIPSKTLIFLGGIHVFIVTVCGLWLLQTLSMCLSVYVCVCVSRVTAYISLTISRILIKLDGNVGTAVQMIVLKFHKNRIYFYVIMTSFLSFKVISKGSYSAQSQGEKLGALRNPIPFEKPVTSV